MNKIFKYFNAYKEQKKLELAYLKELNWANVYHDSIRGKKQIEELSLNIGRWAGNYAFFYVLHTVLSKGKPTSVLELGLGESTKFISTYLKNYLPKTKHVVIEHDESWISFFNSSFELNLNSKIVHVEIKNREVKGVKTISYVLEEQLKNESFDLYVIDGPHGSKRFSRFDIVDFVDSIRNEDNFIIVYDDYHRDGEKETIKALLEKFDNRKIKYKINVFKGIKDVCLIVSESNNFLASI